MRYKLIQRTFVVIGAVMIASTLMPNASDAKTPKTKKDDREVLIQIGDSITHRIKRELHTAKPEWVIDGRNGRNVGLLRNVFDEKVEKFGQPKNWVFELGQNVDPDDDWTKADYEDVIDDIPSNVNVFFVTTYRDPKVFPDTAPTVQQYATWMRQLADERANVFVIPWRDAVIDGHWKGQPAVLVDGSHPDNRSQKTLANMIVFYVKKFA